MSGERTKWAVVRLDHEALAGSADPADWVEAVGVVALAASRSEAERIASRLRGADATASTYAVRRVGPEPGAERPARETDSDPGAEPIYELREVGRSYGTGGVRVEALTGIDLVVRRGEFLVVAGPSGSGKSTLLQLLGTLDHPSEGEISFEGSDLASRSEEELADLRRDAIGFVFQQFNLIPTLTAAENVEAAMVPGPLDPQARSRRAAELLERVGLGHRGDHLPSQLSGGEQQRVAIARALANEPHVLLADEPTGNLDTASGDDVLELIRSLWRETGVTVILITHDAEIVRGAPRVARLRDGRIDAVGPAPVG